MTIDLNFNSIPRNTVLDLIYLIGKTTESAETLDQLVDLAIQSDFNGKCISKTYHCSSLDSVCENPYLSKDSISKLITSYTDDFDIWYVACRDDLDDEIIELIVNHFTKLCIIIELYDNKKYSISESISDTLAKRIMNGEVYIDRGYYKNGQIDKVLKKCSADVKSELLNWWNRNINRILDRTAQ